MLVSWKRASVMNEKIKQALLQAHNERHGMNNDILKLRKVVQWADSQNENFWLPVDESKRPTITQIVRVYELVSLCNLTGVDDIADALYELWLRDKERYLELCSALNREPYKGDGERWPYGEEDGEDG